MVFATSCFVVFSSLALVTPHIFAQETSSAEQIHQSCLDHLRSWISKNAASDLDQCQRCPECGEICEKTQAPSSSSEQEGVVEKAAWADLRFDEQAQPNRESCTGASCTQTCANSECTIDHLGMIGIIMDHDCAQEICHSNGCQSDGCHCDGCQSNHCHSECCHSECYHSDGCQSDCCEQCECDDRELCHDDCAMPEASAYCKDLAELLCTTLNGSEMSEPAMRRVIEKAMILVAKNAQSESRMEMAHMQIRHEEEKAALRGQLLQLSTQVHTVNDLRDWIGPLYANQNRTIQHIQLLSANSSALNRTLSLLEKQLSSQATTSPTATKQSKPRVAQHDPVSEVYDIGQQIDELKQQLQKMRQMQTDKIQPAQHLQPIYNSSQQLEPLESPPFPASMNWAPDYKR
jgi:hypothetical protein